MKVRHNYFQQIEINFSLVLRSEIVWLMPGWLLLVRICTHSAPTLSKIAKLPPKCSGSWFIFKTGIFLAFIIIISLVLQNSSELSLLIRLNHAFEGENTKEHQQEVSDQ